VLGVAALVGLSLARGEEVGDKAAGVVSVMMAKKGEEGCLVHRRRLRSVVTRFMWIVRPGCKAAALGSVLG
jgi:hypothetical protein